MKIPQWLTKLILRQRHGLAVHVGKLVDVHADSNDPANVRHMMVCVCGWQTYWHHSKAEAAAEFRQHASC